MSAADRVLDLVAEFCAHRRLLTATRITFVPNLIKAIGILAARGPDPRWRSINARGASADFAPPAGDLTGPDRIVLHTVIALETTAQRPALPEWCLQHTVLSAAHFARFSAAMREAHGSGIGWLVPACGEVLVIPRPRVSLAEGQHDVPHDDTGRMAVRWDDGSGLYFLRGVHFEAAPYLRITRGEQTLDQVAELPNANQRSVALAYLPLRRLLRESGAQLIDQGIRGTRLYRLLLPNRIVRDRPAGYGDFDYFIHMHDATHPEREFIEWVDPEVGHRGDAELCQAHAFGIILGQWLAIADEG